MIFYDINEKREINSSNHFRQYNYCCIYYDLIKIIIIIIFIFLLFYYYLYTLNLHEINYINEEINSNKVFELDLDNKIEENKYENDIDYSNFKTKIKLIAIYFPNIDLDNFRKIILLNNDNNNITKYYNIKKEYANDKYSSNNINQYLENSYINFIIKQIKFAKRHGLYGFGIYLYWFSGKIIFDKYINKFLEIKSLKFHFLFILNNKIITYNSQNNIIEKEYEKEKPETIIQNLKTFILDKRYIKIGFKPVLCIDNNLKKIKKLKKIIRLWRMEANKIEIGELIIIGALNNKNNSLNYLKTIYDGVYQMLPNYLLKDDLIVNFKKNTTFFAGLIYKDLNFYPINNFLSFRGSTLENKFKISKKIIFGDYYPEYFYNMNKMILNWSKHFNNETDHLVFINAWNDYKKGAYLEPNPYYGYGSINSLSKALFNLNYTNYIYNLTNLINKNLVAVQVHIYYIDLINEIINKTNNIPVQFDLYITTNSVHKRNYIKKYLNKYSKADNYKIKIIENNGRDILPLLYQMKYIFKKYKYLCHIHSKKSRHDPKYGLAWRIYLYKNLLGSKELISNILSDFENNEKLGFIFPETFYEAKGHALKLNNRLKNNINFLFNQIFPGYKTGKILDFPAGNMFWAKFKAIYQIFNIVINKKLCKEGSPLTVLYALERIWLYIVKINGYYYKITCGNY